MDKYTVRQSLVAPHETLLEKNGSPIARFYGDDPNNRTNAIKVRDLLNEVSRSHGKYK